MLNQHKHQLNILRATQGVLVYAATLFNTARYGDAPGKLRRRQWKHTERISK